MTDLPTIAFIGLPLLTGCIGVGLGAWWQAANNSEGYWKAIADREEKRAAANHRKFVNAAKECNAIADSNTRLASALAAKKTGSTALRKPLQARSQARRKGQSSWLRVNWHEHRLGARYSAGTQLWCLL